MYVPSVPPTKKYRPPFPHFCRSLSSLNNKNCIPIVIVTRSVPPCYSNAPSRPHSSASSHFSKKFPPVFLVPSTLRHVGSYSKEIYSPLAARSYLSFCLLCRLTATTLTHHKAVGSSIPSSLSRLIVKFTPSSCPVVDPCTPLLTTARFVEIFIDTIKPNDHRLFGLQDGQT